MSSTKRISCLNTIANILMKVMEKTGFLPKLWKTGKLETPPLEITPEGDFESPERELDGVILDLDDPRAGVCGRPQRRRVV